MGNKILDETGLSYLWGKLKDKFATTTSVENIINGTTTVSKATSATTASKLSNTSAIGSAINPVYFNASGVPVKTTYTLGKSVPSDAVFTDTVYTHPTSGVTAGTYRSVTVSAYGHVTGGSNPTITIAQGGTGATTASGALTNLGITATAEELNKLDGVTATTTELNYVDGVTSNIQTQLNGKLSTSGTAAKATGDSNGNAITTTYVKHFQTLTALKSASATLAKGMTAITLGYYVANDGGGASYRIRTKTSSDVDNGGTIIVINSSLVAEMIVEKNSVNVKQFGAYGNGINDDTAAIQNAINAVPYGTVNFTAGGFAVANNVLSGDANSYKISSTITISKSKVTLNGNGACIASSSLPIFILAGSSSSARIEYVTLKDLTLISTASNTYSDFGIRIKHTLNTIIDNVRMLGTGGGIYCNLNVNMLIRNTRIQTFYPNTFDTTIARGIFLDGNNESRGGISSNASSRFENVLVDMSMVNTSNTESVAFYLEGYDNRDLFFSNCECCNCDYGFHLTGALRNGESYIDWNFDIFVDNFICDAYNKIGIRVVDLGNSGGVHFSRCYLAPSSASTVENALFVSNSAGVTIADSQIYGDTAPGIVAIALTNVSDFTVRGCMFQNCNMCVQSIGNSKVSILDNLIKAFKGYYAETFGSPSYGTAFYITNDNYCDVSHNKLVTDNNCIYSTYIGIANSNNSTVAYNIAKVGASASTGDTGSMLYNSGNTGLIAVGQGIA